VVVERERDVPELGEAFGSLLLEVVQAVAFVTIRTAGRLSFPRGNARRPTISEPSTR